ncbi:MAG: AraC family transcriptional regulator [Terracidiphilus sp.]|nr:AraC family transcriptional regulator [Terracidiphilus sp.]
MRTSIEIPSFWHQLAETMYLKDSPTAEVSLSEQASFAFARVQSKQGHPDIARPIVGESGYLVALQLKAIPFIEQFLGKKKVSSGFYPVGAVSVIDLEDQPCVLLPNPFDALVLYVTQDALDEVAYAHRAPQVKKFAWTHGVFDPVVHQLGQILSTSLEQSAHTSKIFVNHVLHALKCHLAIAYGGLARSSPSRGGLSPMQMRRAAEFLEARLDGNVALQEVADECGLSVSHFARAFRQSFQMPPYKWLTERRVEKAKDLMTNSRLPIADIAAQCGFADQSALNRSFKRILGSTPGSWRRGTILDGDRPWAPILEDTSLHDESRL